MVTAATGSSDTAVGGGVKVGGRWATAVAVASGSSKKLASAGLATVGKIGDFCSGTVRASSGLGKNRAAYRGGIARKAGGSAKIAATNTRSRKTKMNSRLLTTPPLATGRILPGRLPHYNGFSLIANPSGALLRFSQFNSGFTNPAGCARLMHRDAAIQNIEISAGSKLDLMRELW